MSPEQRINWTIKTNNESKAKTLKVIIHHKKHNCRDMKTYAAKYTEI